MESDGTHGTAEALREAAVEEENRLRAEGEAAVREAAPRNGVGVGGSRGTGRRASTTWN